MGLVVDEGPDAAHRVSAGGLHLYDIGPHVGHQLATVHAQGARQVQDPVTRQGLWPILVLGLRQGPTPL